MHMHVMYLSKYRVWGLGLELGRGDCGNWGEFGKTGPNKMDP